MRVRILLVMCACACALVLAVGATNAAAVNQITNMHPVDGIVYSGPTGINPFVPGWTMDVNFAEDPDVTFADPMCDVINFQGDGDGDGWDCDPAGGPAGAPLADGVITFQATRFPTTPNPGVPVTAQSTFTYDSHPPVVSTAPAVPLVNGF